MLQCALEAFDVLSIQITEESTFIIKELVASVAEILRSRNALVVCCTNLPATKENEIKRVVKMAENDNFSGLMNYMNSGDAGVEGISSFLTGLLIAADWNLKVSLSAGNDDEKVDSMLAAHAHMQGQPTHG